MVVWCIIIFQSVSFLRSEMSILHFICSLLYGVVVKMDVENWSQNSRTERPDLGALW